MGNEALKVTVQVQIGGLTVPVNSVVLTHQINSLPFVEISLQLDNQDAANTQTGNIGAVSIDLTKFGKLGALFQQHILNDFSLDTDLQVYVKDGDGNEITFKGYLGKPTFELQNGRLLLGITGIHDMAVLQAFNGQIYQVQEAYGTPVFSNFFSSSTAATTAKSSATNNTLASIFGGASVFSQVIALQDQLTDLSSQPVKNDSIAQRIRVITEGVINEFVSTPGFETEEPLDLLVQALNKAVLPYIQRFLNGSTTSTIIPNISDPVFEDTALHMGLFRSLTGQSNFLISILSMLPDFLFQLNAQWSSPANGSGIWMEHLFTNAPVDGRVIRTGIRDVNYSMGSLFEIPLLQVIVSGMGSEFYSYMGQISPFQQSPPPPNTPLPAGQDAQDFTGNSGLKSLARYPAKVSPTAAGKYIVVNAPYWVNADSFTVQNITMADPPFADPFANTVVTQALMRQRLDNQEGLRQDILNYLAEFVFKDYYLSQTQSGVEIPLNVQVQAGRTYSVQSATGNELFTGYLSRVRHSINVGNEGGNATTTLDFTHIRPSGSKIAVLDNAAPSVLIQADSARSLDVVPDVPARSSIAGQV